MRKLTGYPSLPGWWLVHGDELPWNVVLLTPLRKAEDLQIRLYALRLGSCLLIGLEFQEAPFHASVIDRDD